MESERDPNLPPDAPSAYQTAIEAGWREERRAASLDEIRGMLAQSGDPAAWLAAMTAAGADDAIALLDALEVEDAEQARVQLDRLRDTVDLSTWPRPPVERRQEAISNAEFFWAPADGQRPPVRNQDIHHLIAESTKARLADTHPDHREALITHLMNKADAATPNGGDIVAFVADRLERHACPSAQ